MKAVTGGELQPTEAADLQRLESVLEAAAQTFVAVGLALMKIRRQKLYRGKHDTFEDYCRERWGYRKTHVYQLMDSAGVVGELRSSPIGDVLPATERQARELTRLPGPESKVEAWANVVERVEGDVHKVTAKVVRGAVSKIIDPMPVAAGWAEPRSGPCFVSVRTST